MDYAINLLTNNEKVLFTVAALAMTLALTQIIKCVDNKNILASYYGIIAIFIGGIVGYIGGHYLVPAIDDWGMLYGIVATFIYDKIPDNVKAKIWLMNNSQLPSNIPSRND